MSRPFFYESIDKLESYFDERQTDKEFLQILSEELKYRSTQRAKKLQDRIDSILNPRNTIPEPIPTKKTDPKPINNIIAPDPPLSNKATEVLSAWSALEVLSPQVFKRPEDLASNGERRLIASLEQGRLPWEGSGEKSKPDYKLFYQVVLGTIDFQKAVTSILDVYTDSRVERPVVQGESIIAVIVVDKRGIPIETPSAALSSFAWGLTHALGGDLRILGDWRKYETELTAELESVIRLKDSNDDNVPLNTSILNRAYNFLISRLQIPPELAKPTWFAVRVYEYYKNPEPPEPLLLNSFFLNDLASARTLFEKGQGTVNLKKYLGIEVPPDRRDPLHNAQVLEKLVSPALIPAARWPSVGRHPLVLLQQAAVNTAISELKTDGIIAVNGPPGTGKTTLLRDIVASLVTQRAEIMSTFDNPASAFIHSGEKIKAGQAWLHLYQLDERLKGYEIIITSSNNKAVENVSAELPALAAIADDATDLRYFKPLSDALIGRESWGTISAVLGNMANRSRFRQTFWWDKEVGLSTYLAEAAGTPQIFEIKDPGTGQIIESRKPRIITESNAPGNQPEALERWHIATREFRRCLKKSQEILLDLEQTRLTVLKLPRLIKNEADAKDKLLQSNKDEADLQSRFQTARQSLALSTTALEKDEALLSAHLLLKPGWFSRLFVTSSYKSWREKWKYLFSIVEKSRNEFNAISQVASDKENAWNASKLKVRECESQSKTANALLADAEQRIAMTRKKLGVRLVDNTFSALSHEDRHKIIPWCDDSTQRVRDDVFIQAVKLHKAFIDAAAKPLRHNLGALMQSFSGNPMPDSAKTKLLPDLWSSLFIAIPSISTTFASVERMFRALPNSTFGWLLIDEAGQALPQAAVGAIMRTKRTVVVGDPMQIEPVVTLPSTLTRSICRKFGVDPDRFNSPEASTQTLADVATSYYTEFQSKFGSRSVGMPLLVHRRCSEPMFSIANTVAYDRLMVQAKMPNKSLIRDCLGPSAWIDVRGEAMEKWCPQEGQVVLDLLRRLHSASIKPNIYIITPFVIVAENLRRIIKDSNILTNWTDNDFRWLFERVGTVHTVQGREAEAVIFVLGAPAKEQNGARNWAGGRPNLLNVAVTRAKEVIYVIGNKQLWKDAGLFSELASRV